MLGHNAQMSIIFNYLTTLKNKNTDFPQVFPIFYGKKTPQKFQKYTETDTFMGKRDDNW